MPEISAGNQKVHASAYLSDVSAALPSKVLAMSLQSGTEAQVVHDARFVSPPRWSLEGRHMSELEQHRGN